MGKTFPGIEDSIRTFIEAQPVFFVGSAPLSADGHVNVSPKGLDTLRILGPTTIAYLDLTGSGIETVSHVKENGRIVLMFCAFQGPPRILRVHGRGRVVVPGHPEFPGLASRFPSYEGTRSVIVVEVSRVSDSCGFGVPVLEFKHEREQLPAWSRKLGASELEAYRQKKNRESIDGMPAISEES